MCLEIGASVIPKKEKTNYIKRNEYRVAEQGKSWKFKLINAIDLSLVESSNKEEFIKSMNKLGYQVNWTDTRKYITYTTPEGYKCRDNKLYDEKYSKGAMENQFRRIKEKQSNSIGESSSSINSKDELLSNRANSSTGFVRMEYENERRYKTLSKQAMKEYAMKKANSSSFDWFEDEVEMYIIKFKYIIIKKYCNFVKIKL